MEALRAFTETAFLPEIDPDEAATDIGAVLGVRPRFNASEGGD